MTVSYNLAPIPKWTLRDRNGNPLINGYMKTFRDTVRSEIKPVYSEPSGTLAYLEPIRFDSAGEQGPFYWASDENYYLEVYDSNNNLIWTIGNYNAAGGSSIPVTTNVDFTNLLIDSTFFYNFESPITLNTFTLAQLQSGVRISNGNWFFRKSDKTSTDTITFVPFTLGVNNPTQTPYYYLSYSCTVAGSGQTYRDIEFRIPIVRTLEQQLINISFWASTPDSDPRTIEVFLRQNFGTGGAPSPEVFTSVSTFTLTNSFAQYGMDVTVPSVGGKSLGSNGDDFLSFVFRLQGDIQEIVNFTQAQVTSGSGLKPYDFKGTSLIASSLVPDFNSIPNLTLATNAQGIMNWTTQPPGTVPIGGVIIWPLPGIPAGWLLMNGQSTAGYPALAAIYGSNLPNWVTDGVFLRQHGGTSGFLGSVQTATVGDHTHDYAVGGFTFANTVYPAKGTATDFTTGTTESNSIGAENRPINIAVNFIVRAV